ncbi:1-acyl-sn-glycerol-3-phosphate acyltransferase [Pelomonas sp. KK5]|uniref:lysophospholipid acyltransferase family protein n=1 Tax=Pelomonas sp. KK5 TaxID=1855730 RepID=UPI00097C339D|nr:lysophospholipid acyltransferase family protein [Pelomonas sp. KK5]
MRLPIAIWRLCRLLLHVLRGLAIVHLRFGGLDAAGRQRHIQAWSQGLLRVLGIGFSVRGDAPQPGPRLLVANHASWLDIPAVHALLPEARFVSKAAIRDWPVLGKLVDGAGTIYLERSSKRDALRVVHQAADALKAGDTVAFFPEGTVGPGQELLPFHGNLLQAAISAAAPVQPLVLRWHEPGQWFSASTEFVGETTLLQSLGRILCARGLAIELTVLPVMQAAEADRRAMAEALREQIGAVLQPQS